MKRHHPAHFPTNPQGKGDLFPSGTTIEEIIEGIKQVYSTGARASDNPNKVMQTFEKRITINGESANYRLSVDTANNRVITFFKIGG